MWLELTDGLGRRTVVNMSLVINLRDAADGNTILETAAPLGGTLHVVVVRESLDEVMRLMEGRQALVRNPATPSRAYGGLDRELDFVSDGNEG